MFDKAEKLIFYSFYALFFLTPFAMYSKTSELFEFNKMILVYIFSVSIVSLWIIKIILSGKLNFKKTMLDPFLLIFLLSQLASTVFSVDSRTSLLGYYSRFHGGLASSISYLLLYWAFVSNMDREKTKKAIYFLFSSAFFVSLWAIFEHFGRSFSCLIFEEFGTFDVSCWVQDVQNRVYATLGQPNWLAAWIVALIPLSWAFTLISKTSQGKNWKNLLWFSLSAELFITLLYTKSRSGILAFIVSALIFWSTIFFLKGRKNITSSSFLANILLIFVPILFFTFTIGTPWTANLDQLFKKDAIESTLQQKPSVSAPALEVGGTESGQIRKIVWKGAYDMWKNNPFFGTGVETFAYAYYKYRPVEHNFVSEWNFLYNKAHNEYLNFAATTGSIGVLSYLSLIVATIYLFIKKVSQAKSENNFENFSLNVALLSGYSSILVTNFFGFSVVVVSLQFFLFPAMAVTLSEEVLEHEKNKGINEKLTNLQLSLLSLTILTTLFLLYSISKYWRADTLYARGKLENDSGLYANSRKTLLKAIEISSKESVFWDELSSATSNIALLYAENNDAESAAKIALNAVNESLKATSLSPANLVIKKSQAQIFADLSVLNPILLEKAKTTLHNALELAPTDAQITYNLALIYYKTGNKDEFFNYLKKSVEMKPNYKNARFNLALYYTSEGNIEAAKNELKYILEHIGQDPQVEKELAQLENKKE